MEQQNNVLIIHYSCESFYDREDGRTPRVTSIAVRNMGNGQTESFSIHKVAELSRTPSSAITQEYDRLERAMLDEYFEFVRTHQGYKWVHWNMRDINYGFLAIEHRYRVLGGDPLSIDDSRKYDLSRLLVGRYGVQYIGHPRLESLLEKNKITTLNFLPGKEEADAFDSGDYVRLHQSTLRKADVLASILERAADGTLKTNSRWYHKYGVSPAALGEVIKEHWTFVLFAFLAGVASVIGLYFTLWPRK
ncbi:MAG TPA: hypothetical protein VGC13_29450 [Longimicrobium sp.]|jgi:hypothetical protein|uniref:hypothetical protein n=1 Tax=Longimicrobium sp. TaxID=2029185 RepID=UPI002ED8BC97